MKTLTVRLPELLVAQIEAESRERKLSKSAVVRERLSDSAGSRSQPAPLAAIADLIGSVDGLPADLSTKTKKHLRRRTSYRLSIEREEFEERPFVRG